MTRRLIDLSHTIEHGTETLRGYPRPVICDFLSREDSRAHYAPGTEFHIGRIDMIANTGTYVDSPFHRFADGADLSELPLERIADLPGVVVRAEGLGRAIGPEAFQGVEVAGRAVLVHTGHAQHWQTDAYFTGHPFLTRAASERLSATGAAFVGIDSLNIDDTGDPTRPAHTVLLGAGIPICEHMTSLEQLPDTGFRLTAAPVKVKAFGTFPVRAFAVVAR